MNHRSAVVDGPGFRIILTIRLEKMPFLTHLPLFDMVWCLKKVFQTKKEHQRALKGGIMGFGKDDIAAIYVNEGIICAGCMTEGDWKTMTQDQIITYQEKAENDKIFFCDRCGEPI